MKKLFFILLLQFIVRADSDCDSNDKVKFNKLESKTHKE